MAIQIGQTVRVKTGQQDEETGTSISGWSGRVIAINLEDDMLEVEWDSRTLLLLPDAYIRHSIDGDYDYLRYYIDITSVEPIKPRDAASDVKAAQLALEVHYQDYERYGRRPLPFSEGEEDVDAFFVSEAAAKSKKELLDALQTIEGSGSFAVSGVRQFMHPGLTVEGVGEIALPLSPGQAQDLIQCCLTHAVKQRHCPENFVIHRTLPSVSPAGNVGVVSGIWQVSKTIRHV